MTEHKSVKFDEQTRQRIENLDAVEKCTPTRIYYTDEFRNQCMKAYVHEKASPAALFRQAGLDPRIIGYKRVERCFARWRQIWRQQGEGVFE